MTKKSSTAAVHHNNVQGSSKNPLRLVTAIPKAMVKGSQRITRKGWSIIRKLPIKKPPQLFRWDLLGVTMSYIWGMINRRHLPVALRKPVYSAWAYTFRCNMDEIPAPLESYPSLADFFSRPIKDGARPIAQGGMVSPVDGRVLACGEVVGDKVEQVKGVTYSINQFLGCDASTLLQRQNTKLYQCILYLSPGDYHRIHSSEDWSISKRSHFPGTLFPVNKPFLKLIPSLFALNERIVLMGDWLQGFYSMTAVGAYNVGSISLSFDDQVNSNRITRDFRCKNLEYFSWNGVGSHSYDRSYDNPIPQTKGQEVGQFHLGSTVVLIFEATDFEFNVKQGDYCKMGTLIGSSK
ncbi:hypothetical protein PPL_11383 [Heterostelium album PN500]|uniref:phosphatidylserine decarboxylase n=1 Tax=Heterostelium pallidum (strain ATCC 26659 / Pp 5 / PN500) TaxID=670386 RepID=D3BT90_HETP5|nr:hypothetical protein PPL_11383 [Heterostelium album PN500]EFA75307.1 hypothetical protein PPL_11383 [Heterostelium album PN500]|eukprot:XP_020427441.1 hypothetical protein PPL_11383 [Heterostelium album PN500]